MAGTQIHPSVFIGDGVAIGEGAIVGPNTVLLGPMVIEENVWIGAGSVLGAPPEISSLHQNAAWAGELEHAGVHIGARTVIRESVVIHQGSLRTTRVGQDCWILNRVYLAHDVDVGDGVTISAGVSIGGHCSIGDSANLGMNVSVHQRRIVGPGAMVGMGTALTKDVPPYAKVFGSPPRLQGVNTISMSRSGKSEETIDLLKTAYAKPVLLLNVNSGLFQLEKEISWWHSQEPQKLVPVGES